MNVNVMFFSIFKNGAVAVSWSFLIMYLTLRFVDQVKVVWAYAHIPPLYVLGLTIVAVLIAIAFKLAANIARNDAGDCIQEN